MLMAVSCLSPVMTQTLMPASSRVATASGTPSCSLSSMAVTPTRRRPASTSPATAASASSRPSNFDAASE